MNNIVNRSVSIMPLVLLYLLSACSDTDISYFPVEKGRRWQYDIETKTVEGTRRKKDIVQVMGSVEKDQTHLVGFRSASGQKSAFTKNADEVRIYKGDYANTAEIDEQALHTTILKYPVEVGKNWESVITTSTIATYDRKAGNFIENIPVIVTIESVQETLDLPAGKFRHCLKISARGQKLIPKGTYAYQEKMELKIINTRWYAKGVGLVKEEHQEISGVLDYPDSGYIKTLESYAAP